MTSRPIRIGIIALSRFLDDPRVRRQCEVLQSNGFEVFALGEEDNRLEHVSWTVVRRSPAGPSVAGSLASTQTGSVVEGRAGRLAAFKAVLKAKMPLSGSMAKRLLFSVARKLFFFLRAARGAVTRITGRRVMIVARAQRCRIDPQYAQKIYWSWNDKINELYDRGKSLRCDIWLANDWIVLPIAARLSAENGGAYVYDTHEFALEEYQQRLLWRLAQKPIVAALEKTFIGGAKLVTAVSSGIADRLTEIYRLPRPALTIRNTPRYVEVAFRSTPAMVRVLYHGIVAPGRGLEAAIDSVAKWLPDREFYIRGPGTAEYLDSIRKRIDDSGLQSRVFVVPPVPMTELVVAASEFDVGFFALPGHSLHNQYALPNKFFEYAMAGLALCVSRLPEMTSIVSKYELGSTFAEVTPESIAAAINELSRDKIDQYKRKSLVAAKELCWEAESQNFISALKASVDAKGEA